MKCILYVSLFFLTSIGSFGQRFNPRADSLLSSIFSAEEPGAAVIISLNNETMLKKEYGLANLAGKEKITANTNFNIGSLTKQFTAFCILELEAKKKLSLNDKLVKYFPGFNPLTGNLITIRQLLTHSSGIIDHYAFTDTNIVKHATDQDVLNAVKNIDSTYFIPGTRYRYSNTAYCLLALIIEKVSGVRYGDYIKKQIFDPLSMQHSTVLATGKTIYKQAFGYAFDSAAQRFSRLDAAESIFFSTEGDGGIYMSPTEYLHWFRFLQHPPERYKKIVAALRSPHFMIDSLSRLSYGYGWFVSNRKPTTAVYHTGSNGGFRAIVFTIPSRNYLVAVFSNRTGIDLEALVQQINSLLGVSNNSFTKIEALVSFINSSPIFAACKEIL